jgi:antitoxin MazE
MAIKARIIRIGNSRGVRIPKHVLDETGLSDEVELAVEGGQIVIRAAGGPRAGWAEQFKLMHERGDDRLLEGLTAREHALEAIEALPANASVEDAMERLYLVHKMLRGVAQADAGQTVSQDEARRRMARWLT